MEEQPGILDQGRLMNRPGRGRSAFVKVKVEVAKTKKLAFKRNFQLFTNKLTRVFLFNTKDQAVRFICWFPYFCKHTKKQSNQSIYQMSNQSWLQNVHSA